MIAARESHPHATSGTMLWLCAALAVAVHGALLFAWRYAPGESAAAAIEGDSVEVALVESAPAAAVAIAEAQPPAAQPEPVPQAAPVPPPEPPKKDPEMVLPEPPRPTPPPRTASSAALSPKATPQPAGARKNPAPRNSTAVTTTGGASAPTGTAAGGASTGKSARASYVMRPVAAYPPESRAAGEQGTVMLRLVVDGSGRPTAVSVARSSGHLRLDRAAVEAGWRCRVRDASAGSQLDAPVRFNLSDR